MGGCFNSCCAASPEVSPLHSRTVYTSTRSWGSWLLFHIYSHSKKCLLAHLRISNTGCLVSLSTPEHTEVSCTSWWRSCSLSWAPDVLSNGLWGLTDRLRSPRAVQARRSQSVSIKATGWISAGTPHYLLGGTPISSNWFDKCSSIQWMRDEGRQRAAQNDWEEVPHLARFDKNRHVFPAANKNFWFTSSNPKDLFIYLFFNQTYLRKKCLCCVKWKSESLKDSVLKERLNCFNCRDFTQL